MYFNHAFRQTHIGTKVGGSPVFSGISSVSGFIEDASSIKSSDLKDRTIGLGPGTFGFFDESFNGIDTNNFTNCCPLYLASASIFQKDKIGQFHGGYLESVKSKLINPKHVSKVWYTPACPAKADVVHIGHTPYTTTLSPACPAREFLCNEVYNLRIDLKGSPVLRLLNRNMYRNVSRWTGCCPAGQPVAPVDSTLVFIQWAKDLLNFPLTQPFIQIEIFREDTGASLGTDPAVWDNYVSPGHTTNRMAGMIITGAYVDTKFGDCTFQISDFFEKEPVRVYASMVDETGDVCAFEGLCVIKECEATQAEGFGEQVVRDLILFESYRQNFFHTDLRLREVTQGYDFTNVIDRNSSYHRYFIAHNVPRRNNPTSTFDNDQYLIEIVVPAKDALFEAFIQSWLGGCGVCSADIDFSATCSAACP
jgi:hypothetical protein